MKQKLTLYFILLHLLLVSVSINAQTAPGSPNELDKLFVPDKNSIFNALENTNRNNNTSYYEAKNFIKFNIAMVPRSIAAFYFEKKIIDVLSLEVGLGSCLKKDLFPSFALEVFGFTYNADKTNNTLGIYDIVHESDFDKSSLFSSFSLRFNYENIYSSEWNSYFGLNALTYNNKLILTINQQTGGIFNDNQKTTVRNSAFRFIYGRQFISNGKLNISHDIYMGIGLTSCTYDTFFKEIKNDTNGNSYTFYNKTDDKSKVSTFSFVIGYAFGFGF